MAESRVGIVARLRQWAIARLRRASARVEPGGMVTFPRGVMGFLHGGIARHAMIQKHSIAIGLALVVPPGGRNPFRIQHLRHADGVPSYCDPTFPAYHYTLHSANNTSGYAQLFHLDTSQNRRVRKLVAQNKELAAGGVTTAKAEAALAAAFPHTTGEALRNAINRAAASSRTRASTRSPFRLRPIPRPSTVCVRCPRASAVRVWVWNWRPS